MPSSKELFLESVTELSSTYPKQEAESLVLWLFEHFFNFRRMEVLQDKSIKDDKASFLEALQKVKQEVPIQYILGKAPFYGREFKVTPAVLIPRNETEELVHLILKENRLPSPKILDIGTGTGCIPITLALEIPEAKVFGLDVSHEALKVAMENAMLLDAAVDFHQADILSADIPYPDLDILVSNPPYVRELEKAQMQANVLSHEPHLALFVSDEDPLIFYRTIAEKGLKALKPGGTLYFEINEAFGQETKELMGALGYEKVSIYQDLNGKDRIVYGCTP
ncbi:peptide chain release factor N(5)-glutamine methyltransferase [Litoribacter alkaliphilus]|uniref:Release factor glutamine methyltransferase n=1 Tax=Litoribacter ruber TaxID=702568 RepID=A0AAP2G4U1_9BACT|nr:peptide chain release factor N(5)-glutamine methyltransferase [Litoribacter alkaliphilus]MBS9524376.1 peptide chain release factor N(5)-glutamine methyltransferase [Litoribacter alkaliphilus]